MQDMRLTNRLLKYWALIRHDAPMPDVMHFNPAVVQDLWDRCFRVSLTLVPGKPPHYKYEYIGDAIIKAYGRDLTGQTVQSKMRQFPGSGLIKRMDTISEKPEPVEDHGQFINEAGKVVKYRACLLPLGSQAKGVTHVIVGMSWREF